MDTTIYIGAIIIAILLLLLFGYVLYSGLCHCIDVKTVASSYPSYRVAYKYVTGPYCNVGCYFHEASALAPDKKCLGIYYDDPDTTPAAELRCIVGSILSEGDEETNEELQKLYLKNGFKLMALPAVDNIVVAWFPFTTRLSIYLANMRVWPKIASYCEKGPLNAHPWMELYTSGKITFIGLLDHHDDFVAPEAKQAHAKKE